PILSVLGFFVKALSKGYINTRAAAVSFKFFLAIFPGIIFLFSLVSYINNYIVNFSSELMTFLENFLPIKFYHAFEGLIQDIVNQQNGGVLSFGFLFTVYFATNGLNALINSFNQSYIIQNYNFISRRKLLYQRLAAFLLILILTVLLLLAIVLAIFGGIGVDYLVEKEIIQGSFSALIIRAANYIILLSLVYFSISFMYYIAPSSRKDWSYFSAGSSLATVLISIVSFAFFWYLENFPAYNQVYGSIGTLMGVMLWINMTSIILIIGFELNTSIKNAKGVFNVEQTS
ncbi:MAG: YihY/virulence factor BrkB family protein, partial [Flavobacteriales bacterium]|nr:YihY/virulence factor BrkB family protein [Flavobacteriales bacterium]